MVLSPLLSPNRPPPIPGGNGWSRSLAAKPPEGRSSKQSGGKSKRTSSSKRKKKSSSKSASSADGSSTDLSPQPEETGVMVQAHSQQIMHSPSPSQPHHVPPCISWSSNEDEDDPATSGADPNHPKPTWTDDVSLLSDVAEEDGGNSSQSSPFKQLEQQHPFAQWAEGNSGPARQLLEGFEASAVNDGGSHSEVGGSTSEGDAAAELALQGRRLHDAARLHLLRNELPKALLLFRKILNEQRIKFGQRETFSAHSNTSHPCVGAALHNVGLVLTRMGKYGESLSLLDEALSVRRAALGRDHGDVALTQIQRGTALLHLVRYEEAVVAYRDALRILRKQPHGNGGNKHSQHEAEVLSRLGYLYFEAGELLASGASFEDSIDIYQSMMESDGFGGCGNEGGSSSGGGDGVKRAFAETLCNLGSVQSKKKKFADAIKSFQDALKIQQTLDGEEDGRASIATMDNLAFAYAKSKDYDRAIDVYEDMLQSQLSYHGHYHDEYSRTLGKMCLLEERRKNYAAALECAREILALKHRKHADVDHPAVLRARGLVDSLEEKLG